MNSNLSNAEYREWLTSIKTKIRSVQLKAAVQVNTELLKFYWELGADIAQKQKLASWGDKLVERLSRDLSSEFPDMKGFSLSNLKYIKQWYQFYSQNEISQQAVGFLHQVPWGHNILIIQRCKEIDKALFYVKATIQNSWSRNVLNHQIEGDLYNRRGQGISNFQVTLPKIQSDLASQTLKDPYIFDFLNLRDKHDERELENALVDHVTAFLLELGAGFSYIGRQQKLTIEDDDFYIDLLFYHVRLYCYIVVELKTGKFKPEYAGKLNFYISAVNGTLKSDLDKPTIGILICKSKNDTVVEYSLKDIDNPIGVSEYRLTKSLPEELKSSLPTIDEIEAELDGIHDKEAP